MTTRTEDIKKIRNLLKKITGQTWSVSGSNGTSYGYIRIKTQPRHLEETGEISREVNLVDQWLLGLVFNDGRPVHFQGHQVTPEGRDSFIERLQHLAFKGYTCNAEKAQAKLDESTKTAEHTAKALTSDEIRKAAGTPIESWRLEQIAQTIAHRHTILQATADRLVAEALAPLTMTTKTAENLGPSNGASSPDHCTAEYVKARERLRTILSGLSAIIGSYDYSNVRSWGMVGDLNHYAEVIEGTMCLGETMADGSSAFHPDNLS